MARVMNLNSSIVEIVVCATTTGDCPSHSVADLFAAQQALRVARKTPQAHAELQWIAGCGGSHGPVPASTRRVTVDRRLRWIAGFACHSQSLLGSREANVPADDDRRRTASRHYAGGPAAPEPLLEPGESWLHVPQRKNLSLARL